jgi:uncharacterized membrane protein
MPVVEQAIVIKAPMAIVMEALNDVESIPTWTTVTGTITNVQGNGLGMTYDWHYTISNLNFGGKSEVIEQTENTLITKTIGDIDSIWTITLSAAGKKSTAMRVVVEYSPPNTFVEILTDIVLQQLSNPEVARENIMRFKEVVENHAKIMEEKAIANH